MENAVLNRTLVNENFDGKVRYDNAVLNGVDDTPKSVETKSQAEYYSLKTQVERRGIIVGMLLGDGSRKKYNMYIGHSTKQRRYILFKKDLLENITGKKVGFCLVEHHTGNKTYRTIRIYPKTCILVKKMVRKLYPNYGRKKISTAVLNYLTLPGIALWYMDDGSCSSKSDGNGRFRGVNVTLNTYLPYEENLLIKEYFSKKWGLEWYLNKSRNSWRLGMGTIEARKFFGIIAPYIVPSLAYKIAVPDAKYIGYRDKLNPTTEIDPASQVDDDIVRSCTKV